jgi:hypothetical protein
MQVTTVAEADAAEAARKVEVHVDVAPALR